MANLQQLMAEKAKLESQIEELRSSQRSEAIAAVRSLMAEHGLSVADVSSVGRGRPAANKSAGSTVAAKYRNTASGETWSGRGLQPRWLKAALAAGKTIEEFAI